VPSILIDVNIEGHAAHIWRRLQSPAWLDITRLADVSFFTFRDVGLDRESPDSSVWRFCQDRKFYLLTSNRNEDDESSLEATIRRDGKPESLPVFTLPLPDRVYHLPDFLERVVETLLDYLIYAENIRGTGRLYLP